MDYFKLNRRQAEVVKDNLKTLHMVKAKVCGTPLAQDVYDLLADLCTFLDEGPPPPPAGVPPREKASYLDRRQDVSVVVGEWVQARRRSVLVQP